LTVALPAFDGREVEAQSRPWPVAVSKCPEFICVGVDPVAVPAEQLCYLRGIDHAGRVKVVRSDQEPALGQHIR
jgi:hypothetical protein